ncbi:radical SAM family heme chaperone HemW [Buchnera aphidicola (Macrosiphoniella sanborni)]|uniref:Heme chaperone HemW n=1 Tax=Buchnera aphidicola (Macrosiphoniella sanborni) TaxID=1241865 RepID=A0A4D6Y3G6_9GAMM|nr:radical SAM family heme chaperone HemW [Buchnera aphidicola]QCI24052.1 radical SAM family heme chaperone HemW [Buchnera aphidicola (Macrosiphoniella sanborni)]
MFEFPPLSLYIHIPWCSKKCGYCDFYSYVSQTSIPEEKYIEHIFKDFEKDLLMINNRIINTIFIGGGTPSLLKKDSIQKLILGIKKRHTILNNAEISIEANPKTLEYKNFIHYKNVGINRLSLGIQTFNSSLLKNIERTYKKKEALDAIIEAKKYYSNLNLDLMYGLPDQLLEDTLEDLKLAIEYNPSHISWYQFTIEPNTVFYRKNIHLPHEELVFQMLLEGEKLLKKSGYKKYEISSYAKINYQCKHNLNYWNFGDYIGIGCSAHGKITQKNGTIIRTIKNKNMHHFLNGNYLHSKHIISREEKIIEYFMNMFRLYQPVFKKHFRKMTYINENTIVEKIKIAQKEGLIINYPNHWYVTKKGKFFLNTLLEIFLS